MAVDLFTGAGGLSLGVQEAGWTLAAGVDQDERALETHAHNFPGLSLSMDLGDPGVRDHLVSLLTHARIDLVAGGPPCQPFSRAGRSKIRDLVRNHGRDPQDHRKQLWQAYLDVVTRVRPRAVVMENVPDMGLSDDFAVVRIIGEKLEGLGYAVRVRLVDAWRHGVPQHRKRLILLARNDVERFEWADRDGDTVTLRDAIADMPRFGVRAGERIGSREVPYARPDTLSDFAARMRRGAAPDVIHDHMTRRVRPDDLEIFESMTSRTLYSDLPGNLRRYRADSFTDKYKRLAWDERSRSITAHIAKDGYWYIHPDQPRTLTVREAARIQTFPDRFRFAGTRSDAFRQIGNAVPPALGKAAASAVAPFVGPAPSGFTPRAPRVRADLDAWAATSRSGPDWYDYPGPATGPVQAAVVALLSGSRITRSDLRAVMSRIRSAESVTQPVFDDVVRSIRTQAARTRVSRLEGLIGRDVGSNDVPAVLGMKASEEALYTLLLGERDVMLVNQGVLRVGSRVSGQPGDRTNKLTDGRVNLASLVGAGAGALLRMAALRVIGSDLCTPSLPDCIRCPLREHCVGRPDTRS